MDLPGQRRGGASCRLTLSHGAASLTPEQERGGKQKVFQTTVHCIRTVLSIQEHAELILQLAGTAVV